MVKNKNIKWLKITILCTIICCMLICCTILVNAYSVDTSPTTYMTANGYLYDGFTNLTTGATGSNKFAIPSATLHASQSVPAMSVRAILYNSSGSMLATGSTTYADDGQLTIESHFYYNVIGTPSVFARGICYLYNGNDYIVRYTQRTADLNDYTPIQ